MSKSMQRIHRRKNQQIVKGFVCTYECGKAYGSYAALYTHIKNKHPNMSTYSEIKLSLIKPKATGRKGRPLKKQKDQPVIIEVKNEYQCKICLEDDCVCDEEMGNQEIQKTINIMQDQRFTDLINCIGSMNFGENFTWVRNTEDDYALLSSEDIRKMAIDFIQVYQLTKNLRLNEIWIDFFSFSSKYWDRKYITELYNTMFLIKSYENMEDIRIFLNNHLEFQNMRKCAELKTKEFILLMQIVKS